MISFEQCAIGHHPDERTDGRQASVRPQLEINALYTTTATHWCWLVWVQRQDMANFSTMCALLPSQ